MAEFMSNIREMIRNLAAFFVLGAVLLRLLPGEAFARYLRFSLGLILVLFLLRPVAATLSGEDLLSDVSDPEENLFGWDLTGSSEDFLLSGGSSASASGISSEDASAGSSGRTSELKERIAAASAAEWEKLFQAYQGEILEQMNVLVADLGVTVTEISVQSGGEILTVVIDGEDPDEESAPGGTKSTDTEAEQNVTEGVDTQPAKNGTEDAATEPVKIEIPVISVFAGTGETAVDSAGKESENADGGGTAETGETESVYGSGETEYSADEIITLIKDRIAEYLGMEEEFIEVITTGL